MASKLQIVNRALGEFGHARMASLEESSPAARLVAAVYEDVLEEVLELVAWPFANKDSGALALVGEVDADGIQPVQGWDYLYAIPNGCVKVRSVFPDGGAFVSDQEKTTHQNFEEVTHPTSGATVIATDVEDAYSKFTARVTDTARYTPAFRKLLISALANAMCLTITQKQDLADRMEARYERAKSEAARISKGRENPKQVKTSGYIEARG